MCIQLLQIWMVFEDVLNQGVDVVADGVDLGVDVVQIDLVLRNLVLLWQSDSIALSGCLIFLIRLASSDFDALGLKLDFELHTIRQLIQLRLDPLLPDHLRDD